MHNGMSVVGLVRVFKEDRVAEDLYSAVGH